jgi:ABC-type lipopolysaccharide export system ATPase subunit
MKNESEELHKYLAEIADRSQHGDITWTQPNPSSFHWLQITDDDQFQVVIQKAKNPKSRLSSHSEELEFVYMFQVQSKRNRQTLMSISSGERQEFYRVLAGIFEGAERGIDVRSSNVLRKLLQKD